MSYLIRRVLAKPRLINGPIVNVLMTSPRPSWDTNEKGAKADENFRSAKQENYDTKV